MELDVDENIYDIQFLANKMGITRLVIDSISSFELGMPDKTKYSNFIWAMTDYFKVLGVNLLLIHEMHNTDSVSELTKHGVSYVADNLILLRYVEQGFDVKRYLRVVKIRTSGHDAGLRELLIDSSGLQIGEEPAAVCSCQK
jgi:circadian clock protein KaiC